MLIFNSNSIEFYNYIIHKFMKIERLNEREVGERFLKSYIPNYLYKEQKEKSLRVLNDIYHYTNNKVYYELDAFHEVVLCAIIDKMNDKKKSLKSYNNKYFDKTAKEMIDKIVNEEYEEYKELSKEELKEFYYDPFEYYDSLFEDMDFEYIEYFINTSSIGDDSLTKHMGVNLDYYYDILPKDIREKYPTGNCTLSGEISDLLTFLFDEIKNKGYYKLFWERSKPADLKRIQITLNNIILSYFHNQPIDIAWDFRVFKNRIEVDFYKLRLEETKVSIYFTIVDSNNLNDKYLDTFKKYANNYDNAFFIFLVFTDEENKNVNEYIRKYVYTEHLRSLLNVYIFDIRKQKTASKI